MHKAICDECGEECEVPFKPSSNKPIYCSNCFMKGDRSKSNKNNDSKLDFDNLNAKLDLIIKFLKISDTKKEVAPKKEEIKEESAKAKKITPKKEKTEKIEKKVVKKKVK